MLSALALVVSTVALAAPAHRAPAAESAPAWSASGRLVFARPDAIVVADPASGTLEELPIANAHDPVLSPDGTQLAFTHDGWIKTLAPAGGDARLLSPGFGPEWSPNGSVIAFSRGALPSKGGRVFVVSAGGGGERLVTGNGYSPAWSPDGIQLAFNAGWDEETSAIGIVPAAGGDQVELTNRWGYELDSAWSPDGLRLAYTAEGDQGAAIFVKAVAGGPPVRVSAWLAGVGEPAWRPDGRALAFTAGVDGASQIRLVRSDGKPLRALFAPEAGDSAASWSTDGRMLAFLSARDCGSRVFVAASDGSRQRPLSPRRPGVCVIRSNEYGVRGFLGADELHGGPSDQHLEALAGKDTVAPGRGRDLVDAGSGDDRIYARDRWRDTIRCGSGNDVVIADSVDRVGPSCETIRRG